MFYAALSMFLIPIEQTQLLPCTNLKLSRSKFVAFCPQLFTWVYQVITSHRVTSNLLCSCGVRHPCTKRTDSLKRQHIAAAGQRK
ncbi:hypothetical protein F4823DRAFT_435302 [Ustulina deusta]|nr:hypothetical protein F4823DRAFT_435302 [Ustulina deusta]